MNVIKILYLLFVPLSVIGCRTVQVIGEGFELNERKFANTSELNGKKIYLDMIYQYGLKETVSKDGKVERTIDKDVEVLYLKFRDSLFKQFRDKYRVNIVLGKQIERDAYSILLSPRVYPNTETISKASLIIIKGTKLFYKMDIVNDEIYFIQMFNQEQFPAKTIEELSDAIAEKTYETVFKNASEQ
ncbi:hypothetical protein AB3N61_12225 [Leptospira sp. WS58.C1]|uniref:hypothetical protein n=1 Tax=Leptospira cinconiae TaxID=3235173 RepID=UPI00349EC9E2